MKANVKLQVTGAIAAHPRHITNGDLLMCSGRFCNWEQKLKGNETDSPIFLHAKHVADVVEKVTGL